MENYFGKDTFKLGFGLMRLPKRGAIIDIEHTKRMVDEFIAAGGTYFDTAYIYLGSEAATRRALTERYPRSSYTLATKLNANIAPTQKLAKAQLDKSIERTGAGYIDYYLLHAVMENNYKKYENLRLWDYVNEQKALGRVKYAGFSYHSGPELLDKLLTEHPETDFVQLQINYADWEDRSILSRANYEVARAHGKSIVIMEPVKGGRLADPPAEIKAMFEQKAPGMSPASWAIRFAASLDGVITVLSGMSNLSQMRDNLSYMKDFKPLDSEERAIINQAQRVLKRSAIVPCTGCRYCMDYCPKQIPIPKIFEAMNKQLGGGLIEEAKSDYFKLTESSNKASDCINCKACLRICPQHLDVPDLLKKASSMLEK